MYHIEDDIIIDNGVTLTITKGVTLIFMEDLFEEDENPLYNDNEGDETQSGIFISDGSIIVGSPHPTNPNLTTVTFTTNDINVGWEGIIFDETTNNQYSEIKNAIIEYVKKDDNICGANLLSDGAIFILDFNNILIENCTIRNNSIYRRGGGIFVSMNNGLPTGVPNSTVRIINNNIHNNNAQKGGGICLFSSSSLRPYAYIEYNNIHNNTAEHSGGGISLLKLANANIENNTIYSNKAKCLNNLSFPEMNGGGGIVIGYESGAFLSGNTIESNQAYSNGQSSTNTGLGGGVLVRLKSEIEATTNIISGNSSLHGAGLCIANGFGGNNFNGGPSSFDIRSNYFYDNLAENKGGAVYIIHSVGNFYENTISGNIASEGGGLFLNSTSDEIIPISAYSNFYNNGISGNSADIAAGIMIEGEYSTLYENNFNIYNNLLHSNHTSTQAAAIFINSNLNLNFHNNTVCNNYTTIAMGGDGLQASPDAVNNNLYFVNNIFYYNGLDFGLCQIEHPNFQPNEFHSNNIMNLGCGIPPDYNYDLPPEFLDYQNNNFKLKPYSPLINLGNDDASPISNYDMAGEIRVYGNYIDIGAYEFWPLIPPPKMQKDNDTLLNSNIKIYPNPVIDKLNLISSNQENIKKLVILNMDGKVVKEKSNFIIENESSVDISFLTSGLYILNLRFNDKNVFYKFVKQ